jgi:hypothetical protein
MGDPSYPQLAVGNFVQNHPDVSRFVTAQADNLGGGEAVIHVVFHAEVLAECFRRHGKADLVAVDFAALDRASTEDPMSEFDRVQPALASYVASNVDSPALRGILAHIGLAFTAQQP